MGRTIITGDTHWGNDDRSRFTSYRFKKDFVHKATSEVNVVTNFLKFLLDKNHQ